jgi:hypothetical protein
VLFGTVILGARVVTADDTEVVVEARRHVGGAVLASYAMGSNPAAGNYYSLRIPVENNVPFASPMASLAGDLLDVIVRDATGDLDSLAFTVGSRATVTKLDFGSLDSDQNGLPDAWELQYFGRIGVDPNSMPTLDRLTVMQKFKLGIDPTKANAPHPADTSPFDYSLTFGEVATYGQYWKAGLAWSVAPTDIPVEYVTRAGALWKDGERYTLSLDASTNAPTWWVNVPLGSDFPRGESLVVRTLPEGLQAGAAIQVLLEVSPANTVNAYAVEERILPGWVVEQTSDQGTYLAAAEVIRWGPFFDSQPRTFSYAVRPPIEALVGTFAGVGSFDGSNVDTVGDTDLTPTGVVTRLRWALNLDSGIRLSMRGHPGRRYAIEVSSDLQAWTEWVRVTADSTGDLEVDGGVLYEAGSRFYRARGIAD